MALHFGIIGGGGISETHLKAALATEGVRIAAVVGQNREKVVRLAEMGSAQPYSDFREFLEHRPMEAVLIGSPSGLHAEQGIEAARQGFHVLTEKPIDINCARVDSLVSACEDSGVKLGVLFQDRVSEDLVRLKTLLKSGVLGRPILVSAQVRWYRDPEYYSESKWRGTWNLDGGGALINQGIHTVDLLLWLLGDVETVFARARSRLHDIETEDTLAAVLEFKNGTLATLEAATSAYPGYPRRVILTTTEGTVTVEQDKVVSADLRSEGGFNQGKGEGDRNPSSSSALVSDVRGHQKLIKDFIQAISEDRPPSCSGTEGRRSVELVEAIYKSAKTGEKVVL